MACDDWTPYHLHGWRSVVQDVFGHDCPYLGTRGPNGDLRGVLPLVEVSSRLFGRYLVSMPFLNYGGPLGDPEAVASLALEAAELAEKRGVDLLELRSPVRLSLDLPVSHRKITVRLELPEGDPEVLWKSLRAKVRSQVRRPMKAGVEVRFGPDQMISFYRVFARHMRDLGTPVMPLGLFARARKEFSQSMWFGCAYLDSQAIAGGCGFRWGGRFELVWAAALREFNRVAPNMLLYWRFMERCIEDGASVFDFGRCTPDSGTHKFKAQWGGRDEQLWWYQHGAAEDAGTPSPDSGLYSIGAKMWTRLPLGVANLLGPRIVKYLP
jgi:FemAB-related protein (PEP-CTERM system-associated)